MNKNDHLMSGVGLFNTMANVSARISESAKDHKLHSEYARCVEGVPSFPSVGSLSQISCSSLSRGKLKPVLKFSLWWQKRQIQSWADPKLLPNVLIFVGVWLRHFDYAQDYATHQKHFAMLCVHCCFLILTDSCINPRAVEESLNSF